MIPEKALALAGPDAKLVRRPRRQVAHVYVGPLTPSGRFVPRSARTVCRAHTGRLSVLTQQGTSLERRRAGLCAVCARCSARLSTSQGRAEHFTSREEWARAYAGTTKDDLVFALELAQTPDEVDAAAHLTLLLFEVGGCGQRLVDLRGRRTTLHQLVGQARSRVGGFPDSVAELAARHDAWSAAARDQRIAEAKAARAEREDRITRLGMSLAEPLPRRRR